MKQSDIGAAGDIVYGGDAIARECGLEKRQVFYLVRRGELPGAFKISNTLALSRAAYRAGVAERIAAASTSRSYEAA